MKYVSIDLEATDLDYKSEEIFEFGAVVDDLSVGSPVFPSFNRYVLLDCVKNDDVSETLPEPFFSNTRATFAKIKALRASGSELVRDNFQEVIQDFKAFLISNGFEVESSNDTFFSNSGINVAGKNFAVFDALFLREQNFFTQIKVSKRIIDISPFFWRFGDSKLPNLATCLQRAGMDNLVTHNAAEDALQVAKLVRYCLLDKRWR